MFGLIWWLKITRKNYKCWLNVCRILVSLMLFRIICYSNEVVVTCFLYCFVQQIRWSYHIPDGIVEEQMTDKETIYPNPSITIRRAVIHSYNWTYNRDVQWDEVLTTYLPSELFQEGESTKCLEFILSDNNLVFYWSEYMYE